MKISEKSLKNLLSIEFLSHRKLPEVSYVVVDSLQKSDKLINSINWENFTLDKSGDFTALLCKNRPDLDKYWNILVTEAKEALSSVILKKLSNLSIEGKLLDSMFEQILFDLIGLAVYQTYSELDDCLKSDFFDDLYKIYESGYVPCGYSLKKYKIF